MNGRFLPVWACALALTGLPALAQTTQPPATEPAPETRNLDAAAPSVIFEGGGRTSRGERGLIPIRPIQLPSEMTDGWTFMAGGGALVRPVYIGADRYRVSPVPAVAIIYRDWFFADPANGVGVRRNLMPGVMASAGMDYSFGRKEKDDARLAGMGDLDGGPSLFGEVEFRPFRGIGRALSLALGVESPVLGDVSGVEATADVAISFPVGLGGYVSVGGGVIWASRPMMRDLFGVTPAQSAAGVLPVYDLGAGFRATTLGVTLARPVFERWVLVATANYNRLRGDAGRSPIVADRNQFMAGAGLLYTFGGRGLEAMIPADAGS